MQRFGAQAIRLIPALLLALLTGCEKKPAGSPMNGRVLGETYTNSTFAFTLTVPTNWSVFNRAQLEKGIRRPPPRPKQVSNPVIGASIRIADTELHTLLAISPEAIDPAFEARGVLAPTNTTFYAFAQTTMPGVRDSRDVLGIWVGIIDVWLKLDRDGKTLDFRNEGPREVSLAGRKYFRDTFRWRKNGVPVMHRFYVSLDRGYMLQFVLIAPTAAEMDRLEKILATLQFH